MRRLEKRGAIEIYYEDNVFAIYNLSSSDVLQRYGENARPDICGNCNGTGQIKQKKLKRNKPELTMREYSKDCPECDLPHVLKIPISKNGLEISAATMVDRNDFSRRFEDESIPPELINEVKKYWNRNHY